MKKTSLPKISVCVPAYNRPDTLAQLVNSFLRQTYANKELVISDDSSNTQVKEMISSLNNAQIKYVKNRKNLGFAHNLRNALLSASGKYLVILGDDDVLIHPKTLNTYVETFEKHDDVYYVYANQVQFSEEKVIEYEINMFPESKHYPAGTKTIEKLWLTSIFIGGLGLRNEPGLIKSFYPSEKILHPQVELAGHVMMNHAAYVLKEKLIGFRSRDNQFIFRALTDKNIRKVGKHQNTELFEIYHRLAKKYHFHPSVAFLNERFMNDALILYPKEKMILGNELLRANYEAFCQVSETARASQKLKFILWFSLFTPSIFIYMIRKTLFALVQLRNRSLFQTYKAQLEVAIS